ncbi:MAG: hypothetical protein Q8N13_20755 [Acidovorax sp.]|nr:hypothetical protein [Acidovorax sp.]
MTKIGWTHPIDESDQWDGFNDPGIEHFSGSPTRNLAREVNQNSLDALDDASGKPVLIKISKHSVLVSSIPNVEQLKKNIALCSSVADQEGPKATQFFEAATSELAKAKITVLEISDFHTKGMKGPSRNGTPFYAFTKARGQSKKPSEVSTGSFGIGKFAPYAVSKLRTVFVSTVFQGDDGGYHQLTQGKSILMSHDDSKERRHQGVGFWGLETKCQPIPDISPHIPEWIARATVKADYKANLGTKLVILGFDDKKGWEKQLAASVAENFFGAISAKRLEVHIAEAYVLTADTISSILADSEIVTSVAGQSNEPEQIENSSHYLSCLAPTDDVIVEQSQMLHLGLCELRLRLEVGLPRRVCTLRNGMFISDSLNLQGLKSFSDFKDFVAVFQCKSDKGNELLRAMEPPKHDAFEPDRLPTKDDQEKGRAALRDMARWIRDMLKRHAKDPVSDVTSLDELKDYFAEEGEQGAGDGSEEINPYGAVKLTARPLPQKKNSTPNIKPEGDGTGDGDGGDGGGGDEESDGEGGKGGGKGDGEGGSGAGTQKPTVQLLNPRAVVTAANQRRIAFTAGKSGLVEISLFEVGADQDFQIEVKYANQGTIKDGKVRLHVKENVRETIDVKLSEEFNGALKVLAHGL